MDYVEANCFSYFKDKDLSHSLDFLTGVLNREAFNSYVNHLIETGVPFTIAIIDMDNFKTINDSYGHILGDKVLIEYAEELKREFNGLGVIGRFGGDEFLIVLEGITQYDDIWNIFHNIYNKIQRKESQTLKNEKVTFTSGVVRFPKDGDNYLSLVEKMDKALYRGKVKGKCCFIIYLKEKHENIEIKSILEKTTSTIDLIDKSYDFLLNNKCPIEERINDLFTYLSNTLMFNHLCIQTGYNMKYERIHLLSKIRDFEPLKYDLIENNFNAHGVSGINNVDYLKLIKKDELYDDFKKQDIRSNLCISINAYGKRYGFIRVDHEQNRAWDNNIIELLTIIARTIGILLYHNNTTL